MLMSCGGQTAAGAGEVGINTSVPAQTMADSIAALHTPAESAALFVGWLDESEAADVTYARALAEKLHDAYGERGDSFYTAVDSMAAELPLEHQARILVAVAPSAGVLGKAVRGDVDSAQLVPMIINIYGPDTESAEAFRRGLAK